MRGMRPSPQKIALALVFAALVAAVATLWSLWHREVRAHALAQERAAAESAVLRAELAAAKARGGERGERASTETLVPRASLEPERGRPPGRGRRGGELADFLNDPEVAPLWQKQRHRQVATRYAALFARLGLGAEQTAKLQALLADKQLSRTEAQALARQQGLDRGEARELARQSDTEADAAIRTLLGEAAFAQLQDYDRTMPQRTIVTGLATQLVAAGAPLSAAQQERLVETLAAHAGAEVSVGFSNFPEALGPGGGNLVAGLVFRGQSPEQIQALVEQKVAGDAAVLAAAASFLDGSQLAALRQQQEDQADQLALAAKMAERLRRARTGE